jgi:hypothetical protein
MRFPEALEIGIKLAWMCEGHAVKEKKTEKKRSQLHVTGGSLSTCASNVGGWVQRADGCSRGKLEVLVYVACRQHLIC